MARRINGFECKHPYTRVHGLAELIKWCSRCGAIAIYKVGTGWEWERPACWEPEQRRKEG